MFSKFTLATTCVEEDGLLVFLTFSDIDDGDFVRFATSLSVLKTKIGRRNFKTLFETQAEKPLTFEN